MRIMKGYITAMKRALACLILLVLLLSLTGGVFAQESSDGFQYRVEKDGFASITGYSGAEEKMIIPSEVAGMPVTRIRKGAFLQNEKITSVIVPEGIVEIGSGAFSQCREIRSIKLPSTLLTIGEGAFEHCTNLQELNIPEGVIDIPENALSGIMEMKALTLPSSIQTIGRYAMGYTGFKSIHLPDGLKRIGIQAFGSSALESIVVPNSVNTIGFNSFSDCNELTSVILPIGLRRLEDAMFDGDDELEKVAIHKNVTRIGSDVFGSCYKASIWGYAGSFAETYAKKNDIPFVGVELVQGVTLYLLEDNVTNEKLNIDLNTGINTLSLHALTSPESPWPDVTWKSSDKKIALVDTSGLVTGLKKGNVKITATAVDGSGKKATCEITVANLAKEINIQGENTAKAGKKLKLIATVLPDATSSKKVEWATSDKTIATVDASGTVTAKKVSEVKNVTITATTKDGSGVSEELIITVLP